MTNVTIQVIKKLDITITPIKVNIGTLSVTPIAKQSNSINIITEPSRMSISIAPAIDTTPKKIIINISSLKGNRSYGVPVGGVKNQVLAKKSNTDYDAYWVDNTGWYIPPDQEDGEIIRDVQGLISSINIGDQVVSIIRDTNNRISRVNNSIGSSYIFNRTNGRISSWEVV